jgi:WD40 repeat protein/energy-coupling factor transporter ATP-binding protein EcfA2
VSDAKYPTADDGVPAYFPSLVALKAAHLAILERRRLSGDTPEFLAEVAAFIRRASATGAWLDADNDRWASQSVLDYWANVMYRCGHEISDATLAEFDPALAPELLDSLCPYLGLDSFRESSHTLFFGRQRLIEDLVGWLKEHRLLAVLGPSGSGKSSLVLGGVVPALKSGALPGSQYWRYCPPIVPGSDPLAALNHAIPDKETRRPGDKELDVDGLLVSPSAYLLVVDQFEELWTLCDDQGTRQRFAHSLLELTQAPGTQHTIILTMRSDFESLVVQLPTLQPHFEQAAVRVTPLNAAELREAIERPADLVGLKFEAGVVEALLQDILGEPAALPLLQFTLLKLWENRERNWVTWEAYHRLGGGRLALAHSADAFYERLIPEEQVTVRRILLRMVRPGEGLEVTSNRVRREALYQAGEAHDRVERVLDKLIRARLIRLTEGELLTDTQVEVAHEALVRNWPRLVDWLEDERAAMMVRRRLEAKAAEWVRLGRGSSGLLDAVQLHEAERWLSTPEAAYLGYDVDLPALVSASRAALEEAERIKEAGRQRELAQAQALAAEQERRADAERRRAEEQARARGRLRRFSIGLVVLLALAVIAMVFALYQQRLARLAEAEAQKRLIIAESQRLAFAAQGQLAGAPEIALLLASEAVERDHNPVSEQALRDAIQLVPWSMTILNHSDSVTSAVFSPDGRRVLTASQDKTARLWDLTGAPLVIFKGHTKPLTSALFSPDGRRVLTASQDKTARLWDLQGTPLVTFTGHTSPVTSLQFSPDGRQILTTSRDGTARLWDLTGTPLVTFKGHTKWVRSAVFSPDRQRILTASEDGTARLWDLKGTPLVTFTGHIDDVRSAVFSPDGQRVLTASADKTARLWNLQGKQLFIFKGHTDVLWSAVFSPDGSHILTASTDYTARLWDLEGRQTVIRGYTRGVPSAQFSADGQRILIASRDGTAGVWDLDGRRLVSLTGHANWVTSAVFSPDERRILTASLDGTARLWELIGPPLATLEGHTGEVPSAVFSPDGQRVLTASADMTARLWDLAGTAMVTFTGHTKQVARAAFSPDGQYVLTASADKTARLWDLAGTPLVTFTGHTKQLDGALFSPDGQRVLTTSADGTARLWDLAGTPLVTFTGHTGSVTSASFSSDGQRILTSSLDDTAKLWDLEGRTLITFVGHTDRIIHAVFSPDGERIVTTSRDRTARLWDLKGTPLAVLRGHTDLVESAVFSPDGQRVLTSSDDGTARLWNLMGKLLVTFNGHTDWVLSAVFSPDGRRLLTASRDHTARQYFVNVEDVLKVAACRVGRGLNDEEIARFEVGIPRFVVEPQRCPRNQP